MAEIIYAITDCHGCADMLWAAYDAIARHAGGRPARVVFLGDAIDRGPDSKGCIDRLIAGAEGANFAPQIDLMGNHEEMMLESMAGDRDARLNWLLNGGEATLRSYGAPGDFANLELPSEHTAWLAGLAYAHETETHIFVHAGLPPGMGLGEALANPASRRRLIWIRGAFLEHPHDFGKHVVHGHSPVGRVDFVRDPPFRTNLDTGAVYGGPLTIGVIAPGANGRPERITIANPG
jgi:serine/threonine protein phosphatase 1